MACSAGPLLVVDAGVHHQAHGAEQLGIEIAQFAVGIVLVEADLTRQFLGVQRPAFGIGRERHHAAEERHAFQFLGDRELEVVTGDALMIGERFHPELLDFIHITQVGVEDARAFPAQIARLVVSPGGGLLAELRDALDLQGGLRADGKVRVQPGIHLVQDALVFGQCGEAAFIRVRKEEAFLFAELSQFLGGIDDILVTQSLQDGHSFRPSMRVTSFRPISCTCSGVYSVVVLLRRQWA